MDKMYLLLAIVLEVIGSSFLKVSDGFTKAWATLVVLVAYLLCFYFLSLSIKTIPLGVAYALWAGLGIILTAIVSIVVFKHPLDLPSIIGFILIITEVTIINFYSKAT